MGQLIARVLRRGFYFALVQGTVRSSLDSVMAEVLRHIGGAVVIISVETCICLILPVGRQKSIVCQRTRGVIQTAILRERSRIGVGIAVRVVPIVTWDVRTKQGAIIRGRRMFLDHGAVVVIITVATKVEMVR